MATTTQFLTAEWDKAESTFIQEIYFINGKMMSGYSKRMNNAEPNNKFTTLTNWILRMYRDGYLNKDMIGIRRRSGTYLTETDIILYYRNDFPDRMKVASLAYDYFLIHEENLELDNFLSKFYQMKSDKVDKDTIFNALYSNRKTLTVEPLEIPRVSHFSHPVYLLNYCASLYEKKKATKPQLLEFFDNYMERFFKDNGNLLGYSQFKNDLLTKFTDQ